jgi:hypothetical protein
MTSCFVALIGQQPFEWPSRTTGLFSTPSAARLAAKIEVVNTNHGTYFTDFLPNWQHNLFSKLSDKHSARIIGEFSGDHQGFVVKKTGALRAPVKTSI